MSDLVERARKYATEAHQRINQRRKYNNEPYHVHLSAVAKAGRVGDRRCGNDCGSMAA